MWFSYPIISAGSSAIFLSDRLFRNREKSFAFMIPFFPILPTERKNTYSPDGSSAQNLWEAWLPAGLSLSLSHIFSRKPSLAVRHSLCFAATSLRFSRVDNVQSFSHIFLRLARSSSPLPEIRPSWEAFAHPRSGCLLWFLVTKNSVHS